MSPPGPGWRLRGRANFRAKKAEAVNARAAIREWVALADAIEARGGRVACLLPAEDTELTGLPYAAECGQVVARNGERLFVLPNMSAPHRLGERELWREVALALGFRPVVCRGVWEAQGDVARFSGVTLLFFGGRTDREGVESAAEYFPGEKLLLEVQQPAFHGNMALLPLEPAGKLLACPEVFERNSWEALQKRFGAKALVLVTLEEICSYATNGLLLGSEVLVPSLVPARVKRLFESFGLGVVDLPMDELCGKGGGACRCLVSFARVDGGEVVIPEEYDYRRLRERVLSHA